MRGHRWIDQGEFVTDAPRCSLPVVARKRVAHAGFGSPASVILESEFSLEAILANATRIPRQSGFAQHVASGLVPGVEWQERRDAGLQGLSLPTSLGHVGTTACQ